MLREVLCKNPACQKPLKTKLGKTGLCRPCSVMLNGKLAPKYVEWKPDELTQVKELIVHRKEIQRLQQALTVRHTHQAVYEKIKVLQRKEKKRHA